MRILILGNNHSSKEFFYLFKKNKENIVFSTICNCENYIEFKNVNDILEFCEANEINLVLITDEDYINQGIQEAISAMNISVFAPSIDAINICASKAFAKRFMYKNKIQTPKFQIIEKPQIGYEYLKQMQTPQVIRPDGHSFQECSLFCETYSKGQEIINQFFASGNKKIIIEDYIEGKNISAWVLSNGYSAKIIGTSAKYQNNISLFEPSFVTEELKEEMLSSAINPTISALNSQDEEYIGILGFDFIQTFDKNLYLVGYNSFFDDINVEFFTKGFNINWAEVFDSTIIGDVFSKFEFLSNDEYMLSLRQNEEIKFVSAKTKTNLERYLKELNYDTKEYEEAKKIWKF